MEDPVNREKVELAKNFTFHLLKGIKQIGMYRHNEARFSEFLGGALEAVNAFTEKHGPLSVKVEQQNFSLYGQPLFSEDTPLPYKFFRDGIRQLIFRPGLGPDELVTFTLIALSDPERGAEDVLAQLWKAQLEHLEYIVVEGFKMDELGSEEDVQVEVDQIVGYLYQRLKTSSDDFLRFARVSTEDLEAKVEGIEQIRGAVITGVTADDALKARLQGEIADEEGARLFPKLVSAIFQVVEGGLDDPGLLEEVFVQLLDAMLMQEDLATVNAILLKLKALEQRDTSDSFTRLRMTFAAKMGEEQRLMRIGDLLKHSRPKHPQDISRYLAALDSNAVPSLLAVLDTIEVPENRSILVEVLAPHAKEIPEPFLHRLESERSQTVRDMVAILEKSGHPDRLKMYGQVMRNRNLAVRLEVMNIIARSHTGESRRLIHEALNDPNAQVRMQAARLLPEFDRDKAWLDISRCIRDASFDKKSAEEKAVFYAALGSTGVPGALSHLSSLMQAKSNLLNRKRVLDEKLLAIHGLEGAGTIQSYRMLQQIVDDKSQPLEVLTAARKAIYLTKKALFGETGTEGT